MLEQTSTSNSPASILIIEDDSDMRGALGDLLENAGYSVAACRDALDGLDHLHHSAPPDVILLDLKMERMDGWQFRLQQRRDPDLSGIPVIVMSADASPQAAAIDADAYLAKPLDYSRLLETIDRVLLCSERERVEARHRETDRLTAIGTLAAGLAHEINNPLAVAVGNLNLLERLCASIAANDDLEACKVVAERMSRAITDSLAGTERIATVVSSVYTFSRPESQVMELVDLREIVNVAIQLARAEMRPRAQLLRDDEDVPRVRGSTTRLVQVFLNLLMNAAQAIPEGRPHDNQIRVSTRLRAGEVIVEISDTGRGIAPEQLGRIYDPFFSTRPVGRGMGLGLSISHAALQAMGGSIDVESEVAKGSTFRVRLPAVHESTPSRQPPPRSLSHAAPGRRKVLIIDDEPLLCNLLKSLLSDQHDVCACTDARLAVERVRSGERFDLILCDLMMPEMTGMDVHAVLLREAPQQVERMVFLTGGAFTPGSRQFLDTVPNRHILKPFKIGQILDLVAGSSPSLRSV